MAEKIVNILLDRFCFKGEWDGNCGEYYFPLLKAISDITDTADPQEYLDDIKKSALEEGVEISLNSKHTKDGIEVVNATDLFRIIQLIPSPNAESIKLWLADVGYGKIKESINPDLIIYNVIDSYRKQGRSEEWIIEKLESMATA